MKKVIVIYGLPAAGKTTQAALLNKKYGFYQFGMGDRLRAEINSGSELGVKIKETVASGLLVSDELIAGVLQNIQKPAQDTGIIFDGFPRMVPQAELLDRMLAEVNLEVDLFILLAIDIDEAEKRIEGRAALTGRSDDQDKSVVNNRLEVFRQESKPLIARYQAKGKFIEIDGSQPINEVFAAIEKSL